MSVRAPLDPLGPAARRAAAAFMARALVYRALTPVSYTHLTLPTKA